MLNSYAVLHTHDTFGSIGDSVLLIKDYVSKAKQMGIENLAITNHGSMSTFVNFYEECRKNLINPIIGCEVYFCDDRLKQDKEHREYSHLILLAKNYNGLKNLLTIHNYANIDGFYYKPRTDWELLEKYHEDIICLSACIASPLAKYLIYTEEGEEDYIGFEKTVLRLKKIFGADFYFEIQPGKFEEQLKYNSYLSAFSKKYDIKLVATNDIHYLDKEDYLIHDYHVKDARKADISSELLYKDKVYYLMYKQELIDSFVRWGHLKEKDIINAVENTLEIAKKCHIILPEHNVMPKYSSDIDEESFLQSLCIKKLAAFFGTVKYPINKKEYINRLSFELSTIQVLGFSGYFLIVKDIIDFCDNNNIARGPGRGSGAGSLVSFLLNISIADPIKYDLMFERFLSASRKSIPDIDLDIAPEGREAIYRHLKEKYGFEHCCFIRTYGMRKARNAIKAACRILNVNVKESNEISKTIPYIYYDKEGNKHSDVDIDEALNNISEFRRKAVKFPEVVSLAKQIEGYPSSAGIHPAGIVICPFNIMDRYPLVPCKNDYFMATSLDLKDVEKLSGVKFDLLSLSSLTAINKTIKDVGIRFNYTDESFFKDEAVWNLIGSSDTCGLFQISSNVYKSRMDKLHPKSIQELAACLALVRGPCISSGADKKYISILNGEEEPVRLHDVYWNATKNTKGILIYQEQILKICMNIGFNSEVAYKILKAVSKKKVNEIKKYKEEFYSLAAKKEILDDITDKIWQEILNSGLYAFNIAHATSYALLCYSSAYLMVHYPVHYLSNLLSKYYINKTADDSILLDIISSCKKRGIKILPPSINSAWEFTVENNKIRAGFCSIKGIGKNCYQELLKHKNASTFVELLNNVSGRIVNKKSVLILILAGIFKKYEDNNKNLIEHYIKDIRKEKEWDYKVKIGGTVSIDINKDDSNKISKKIFNLEIKREP